MKKIGVLNCIYIRERKITSSDFYFMTGGKIMFKKIISFIAAAAYAAAFTQTAVTAESKWNIVVDVSDAVQAYEISEQDENGKQIYCYTDKDGSRLNGTLYVNAAGENDIPWLRLAEFEDGSMERIISGFTKSSKGKRYYESGERVYGWKKIDGYWYHFDTKTGYAATDRTKICGAVYEFDEKGRWTNRVSKNGFAPEDFSVNFSTNASSGFDTAEKKLYYGWAGNGIAEADIKISAKDKQILWCMFLESGFERDGKEIFDLEYMDHFCKIIPDDCETEFYETEPETVYTVTVTAGGKTAKIEYNTDTEQIALLDEKSYRASLLCGGYRSYFGELEEKYPYSGDDQIFYLE